MAHTRDYSCEIYIYIYICHEISSIAGLLKLFKQLARCLEPVGTLYCISLYCISINVLCILFINLFMKILHMWSPSCLIYPPPTILDLFLKQLVSVVILFLVLQSLALSLTLKSYLCQLMKLLVSYIDL